MEETPKPVHTLVLDTGAIIKNEPSVSTLISKADSLVTVPAIISEIKDVVTRSRVETMLMPFLTVRAPSPASMQFVTEFARRTGDLPVLSKPDLQIIALTYELEVERNGGDWRLRKVPGQKALNGPLPAKEGEGKEVESKKSESKDAPVVEAEVKTEEQPQQESPAGRETETAAEVSEEPVAEVSPPEQRTVLETSNDAEPVAEVAEVVGDEQAVVVGGDPRLRLGQDHLDQLDGRAEERPLLHHRRDRGGVAGVECVVDAEP